MITGCLSTSSIVLRLVWVFAMCFVQIDSNNGDGWVNRKPHNINNFSSKRSTMVPGNDRLIPGLSIHGAVIVSDLFAQNDTLLASTINKDDHQKILARIRNVKDLEAQLPFNLTHWSAITAGPCPHYPTGHKVERGLLWAHYRIWRDFVFFDEDVLLQANQTKQTSQSKNGVFVDYGNGTRTKDHTLFKDEDILVVFEDDASSCISDTHDTIVEELRDMKGVNILYLGWCEGRAARPVPLCSHAYAITRTAARKLVYYLEPCGRSVDEQFVILAKNNWLSYRRAHPYSYKNMRPDYNGHGDKTQGIFRQCKADCGSMLGH
jgi:hypothetical protein